MKFAVATEQREYFQKKQAIELEEVCPSASLLELNREIDSALALRLGIEPARLNRQNSSSLFSVGRDVWRDIPFLRKKISSPRWTEIAADLLEIKPLRLGYDQYFPGAHPTTASAVEGKSDYLKFLEKSFSLEEMSCLQGVLCGLMLCLKEGDAKDAPDAPIGIDVFSRKEGNGVYFRPEAPIDWSLLTYRPGYRYLLIVYVRLTTMYALNTRDPHVYDLKKQGYVFGDKLSDRLNPLVYR